MSNTITAYFKGRIGVAESVYQNDYGIVMAFDSIDLPAHFACYFSRLNQEEALPGLGADNRVTIPNSILANPGNVTIHIPLHTGSSDSEVEYVVYFKVIGRARPEDDGTPAQMTAVEQALALLQTPITNIEEIVNEALSFTGDTFDEMQAALDADQAAYELSMNSRATTFESGITSRQTQVESDFSNLDAQFQTAVSALTVDDELLNVRVGDDNVTYATAGEAVRKQFSALKKDAMRMCISDTVEWVQGALTSSAGVAISSDIRLRTDYIDRNILFVTASLGYDFCIFVYDENDVYLGNWTGTECVKAYRWNGNNTINLSAIPNHYNVRLMLSKSNDTDISPSDSTNIETLFSINAYFTD